MFPEVLFHPRSVLPLAAALLFLALAAAPVSANPPTDMKVAYDQLTSVLSVTITHPPMGMTGHYIREVKVSVNGNVANDSFYTSQPGDTFTYTYPLPLKPGDVAEATATCSLSGSATRTFIMPGPTGTVPPGGIPAGTPKASVPLTAVIAAIGAAVAIRKKH